MKCATAFLFLFIFSTSQGAKLPGHHEIHQSHKPHAPVSSFGLNKQLPHHSLSAGGSSIHQPIAQPHHAGIGATSLGGGHRVSSKPHVSQFGGSQGHLAPHAVQSSGKPSFGGHSTGQAVHVSNIHPIGGSGIPHRTSGVGGHHAVGKRPTSSIGHHSTGKRPISVGSSFSSGSKKHVGGVGPSSHFGGVGHSQSIHPSGGVGHSQSIHPSGSLGPHGVSSGGSSGFGKRPTSSTFHAGGKRPLVGNVGHVSNTHSPGGHHGGGVIGLQGGAHKRPTSSIGSFHGGSKKNVGSAGFGSTHLGAGPSSGFHHAGGLGGQSFQHSASAGHAKPHAGKPVHGSLGGSSVHQGFGGHSLGK